MSPAAIVDFVLLAAIWGASFLFMRLAVVDFGALPTAAARVAIATAFLVPLMLMRGLGPTFRQHWKSVLLIGLINSGIPFALFAFAVLSITTGLSAILNATVPLFGAIVAWVWLGERLDASRMVGLAMGFVGVGMLAWDKAGFRPEATAADGAWAVLACLVATVFYGIAANATKRYLKGLPSLVTATGSQMGATLGLLLPALWLWPAQMPGAQAWVAVTVVGVLCTGVAYVLYFRLIESLGPARAVTVTFAIPVFAIVYGAVFLDEPVTPWMVLCGAVIICGVALSTGLIRLPRRAAA
ncbi:DMT family transporter [Ramlibacter albus]|uniref:DMT family transporter n=1 Tax=Ramlibacter albus TaxID=2079448 RepID=A0A923S678_9BURK|nr:DMT family transporter [Ramlibacter albus]MBC5765877.1 DMT family transporter [Ramlibacter albus]